MEKYIIIGEYKNNGGFIYVSNTNPICWVKEESLAKSYSNFIDAAHDIISEHNIYKTTVNCTYVNYISILDTNTRKITPIIDSSGDILDSDEF